MSRTQPSPAFKWETAEARFEDALRLHRKRVESVLPDGIEIVFRITGKGGGVWTLGRRSAVNLRQRGRVARLSSRMRSQRVLTVASGYTVYRGCF